MGEESIKSMKSRLQNNLGLMILGNEFYQAVLKGCLLSCLIRVFELATHRFELVTRGFELVTCGSELITRGLELALLNFNSCF